MICKMHLRTSSFYCREDESCTTTTVQAGPNDPASEAPGVEADVAEVTRVSYRKRVGLTCSKMKISDLIFCVYIFLW